MKTIQSTFLSFHLEKFRNAKIGIHTNVYGNPFCEKGQGDNTFPKGENNYLADFPLTIGGKRGEGAGAGGRCVWESGNWLSDCSLQDFFRDSGYLAPIILPGTWLIKVQGFWFWKVQWLSCKLSNTRIFRLWSQPYCYSMFDSEKWTPSRQKPVFVVCDRVRLKPACSTTETS